MKCPDQVHFLNLFLYNFENSDLIYTKKSAIARLANMTIMMKIKREYFSVRTLILLKKCSFLNTQCVFFRKIEAVLRSSKMTHPV